MATEVPHVFGCPFCHEPLNGAVPSEGEAPPRDGDISLCFHCGEWGFFFTLDGLPSVRRPTDAERQQLDEITRDRLTRFQNMIRSRPRPFKCQYRNDYEDPNASRPVD